MQSSVEILKEEVRPLYIKGGRYTVLEPAFLTAITAQKDALSLLLEKDYLVGRWIPNGALKTGGRGESYIEARPGGRLEELAIFAAYEAWRGRADVTVTFNDRSRKTQLPYLDTQRETYANPEIYDAAHALFDQECRVIIGDPDTLASGLQITDKQLIIAGAAKVIEDLTTVLPDHP